MAHGTHMCMNTESVLILYHFLMCTVLVFSFLCTLCILPSLLMQFVSCVHCVLQFVGVFQALCALYLCFVSSLCISVPGVLCVHYFSRLIVFYTTIGCGYMYSRVSVGTCGVYFWFNLYYSHRGS